MKNKINKRALGLITLLVTGLSLSACSISSISSKKPLSVNYPPSSNQSPAINSTHKPIVNSQQTSKIPSPQTKVS